MSRYTIEKHGDAYALYFGRTDEHHGYNLCRIDDLAHNCDLEELERLLNAGLSRTSIVNKLKENGFSEQGMCRLPADFEAAIYDNLGDLYERD